MRLVKLASVAVAVVAAVVGVIVVDVVDGYRRGSGIDKARATARRSLEWPPPC